MVRGQMLRDLEPVGRDLIEDLALEGNGSQHDIEGADPVGDHDDAAVVLDVTIPDLALVLAAKRGKIRGF